VSFQRQIAFPRVPEVKHNHLVLGESQPLDAVHQAIEIIEQVTKQDDDAAMSA
jgi:hypothetical protein